MRFNDILPVLLVLLLLLVWSLIKDPCGLTLLGKLAKIIMP